MTTTSRNFGKFYFNLIGPERQVHAIQPQERSYFKMFSFFFFLESEQENQNSSKNGSYFLTSLFPPSTSSLQTITLILSVSYILRCLIHRLPQKHYFWGNHYLGQTLFLGLFLRLANITTHRINTEI